jgi:hypothetical protein
LIPRPGRSGELSYNQVAAGRPLTDLHFRVHTPVEHPRRSRVRHHRREKEKVRATPIVSRIGNLFRRATAQRLMWCDRPVRCDAAGHKKDDETEVETAHNDVVADLGMGTVVLWSGSKPSTVRQEPIFWTMMSIDTCQ